MDKVMELEDMDQESIMRLNRVRKRLKLILWSDITVGDGTHFRDCKITKTGDPTQPIW